MEKLLFTKRRFLFVYVLEKVWLSSYIKNQTSTI